jgi:hypothetical protein
LVTGATGAGKTTTVLSVLQGLEKGSSSVDVTILEGAKREYRQHKTKVGIDKHYDLMADFLKINIFDHPPKVTPEAHISQLASLFESTLDMPAPLPALMREALANAYTDYHQEEDERIRVLHPIRFWLKKSLLELLEKRDYSGEIADNIEAALQTRLQTLGQGACGQVLSGNESWPELSENLATKSSLLELESIADRHNRSFVMALFVLYYRYALETQRKSESLSNVLVLEEAHRIIGKSGDKTDTSLEYFSDMLSEVRAFGCGMVISDQSPDRLIDDAMRNTNTKIIMRLVSGKDIEATVQGAGLPREAAKDIPRLKKFQAIYVQGNQRPGLVRVEPEHVYSNEIPEQESDREVPSGTRQRNEHLEEMRRARLVDSCLKRWIDDNSNTERIVSPITEEFDLDAERVKKAGWEARDHLSLSGAERWHEPDPENKRKYRRLPLVWLSCFLYPERPRSGKAV